MEQLVRPIIKWFNKWLETSNNQCSFI